MSSQADSLGIADSGDSARGAFGLSASHHSVYPFKQWQAAWQQLGTIRESQQRLIVLLGDPGTGKSTMLEHLARSLEDSGNSVARLRGAQVDGLDFFLLAAISLGLNLNTDDPQLAEVQLREQLLAKCAHGALYLLVDDADMLGPFAFAALLRLADLPLLEGFRKAGAGTRAPHASGSQTGLVSSANEATRSSRALSGGLANASKTPSAGDSADVSTQTGLKIVLAAPYRLLKLLDACLLDPRNESSIGRVTLGTLTNSEIGDYLAHGLAHSQKTEGITISNEVATAIHHYSRGIPRMANHIAARLLFLASESGSRDVTADDVMEVVGDLQSGGMLDKVAPLSEPDSGRYQELPVLTPHQTAPPEAVDVIDKSVASLVASELRKQQPAGATGLPPWRQHEVSPPVQSVGPSEARKSYPWSALTLRRAWLLVPSIGLAIVLLSVVVGLQFLNNESPANKSTNRMPLGSEQQVAEAGSETKPSAAGLVESTDSTVTAISPQPSEILAESQQASSGADPRTTSAPEIESVHPTTEKPLASAPHSAVAVPQKPGDLELHEPVSAKVLADTAVPPPAASDEMETASADRAAGASEEPVRVDNLDKSQPIEAPAKLASDVGEPDTALALPPPSIDDENHLRLGNVDKKLSIETPEQLASHAGMSDKTLPLLPAQVDGDKLTAPSETDSAQPILAQEQVASSVGASATTLPMPPPPVDSNEMIAASETDTTRPVQAREPLASGTGASDKTLPVPPSPTEGNKPAVPGETVSVPSIEASERLAFDAEAIDTTWPVPSPPVDFDKLSAPSETESAPPGDASERLASAAEASDTALPVLPRPVDDDQLSAPSEADSALPTDTPERLASAAEASDTALPVLPRPVDDDQLSAPSETDSALPAGTPERFAPTIDDSDTASPLPYSPAAGDRPTVPGESEPGLSVEAPPQLASGAEKSAPALSTPLPPADVGSLTRSDELDAAQPVEAPEQLASSADGRAAETVEPEPIADSDATFSTPAAPDTAPPGGERTAVDDSQPQNSSGPSQVALLTTGTTASEATDTSTNLAEDLRIQELLRAAKLDMRNSRLTVPEGNNAFERYQSVLDIDPANEQALTGFEEIARTYVALVQRARAEGELDLALRYLDRADKVLPEFEETVKLRQQISDELDTEAVPTTDLDQADTNLPTRERFVILPVRTSAGCAWPFDQHMMSAVRNVMKRPALDRVALSGPSSAPGNGGQRVGRFWSGAGTNEVPNAQQIYRYGQQVGARWVLLSRIDCPASATIFEPWRDFQLHLFDIKQSVSHQRTGTLGEIGPITERVLLANVPVEGG